MSHISIGTRFGRLRIVRQASSNKQGTLWTCLCDCGTETIVRGTHLRAGVSQSCGCLRRDLSRIGIHWTKPWLVRKEKSK